MADDIVVRPARSRADYDACVMLQRSVWGLEDLEITSAIQLIATTHAGGMLHVAEAGGGQAVGFAYAFPALRGGVPPPHSHMVAGLPEDQQRGGGLRLEWAPRRGAPSAGLGPLALTFDPLQARNANLNLRRLGASATEFLENLYGVTTSSLHHGLPTDRLLVRWELASPRVQELTAQGEPSRTVSTPSAPRINEVKWQ